MREKYKDIKFSLPVVALIEKMNAVVADLQAQGYRLTVRQLYYQLVSADVVANTIQSYKRVASVVNDARLAGAMDWEAIEDRTREFVRRPHWGSGGEILDAVAGQYFMDMWDNQSHKVFVVIEKEALAGVFEPICKKLDVPLLAARGYPSVSVVREFVEADILDAQRAGQECHILHFGDHDPSGIDMTRDLEERVHLFTRGEPVDVQRCALNMDQIRKFRPPPNPAKVTDSRFAQYEAKFGASSWELDAMRPKYLNDLVEEYVMNFVDHEKWEARGNEISDTRDRLRKVAAEFDRSED